MNNYILDNYLYNDFKCQCCGTSIKKIWTINNLPSEIRSTLIRSTFLFNHNLKCFEFYLDESLHQDFYGKYGLLNKSVEPILESTIRDSNNTFVLFVDGKCKNCCNYGFFINCCGDSREYLNLPSYNRIRSDYNYQSNTGKTFIQFYKIENNMSDYKSIKNFLKESSIKEIDRKLNNLFLLK